MHIYTTAINFLYGPMLDGRTATQGFAEMSDTSFFRRADTIRTGNMLGPIHMMTHPQAWLEGVAYRWAYRLGEAIMLEFGTQLGKAIGREVGNALTESAGVYTTSD